MGIEILCRMTIMIMSKRQTRRKTGAQSHGSRPLRDRQTAKRYLRRLSFQGGEIEKKIRLVAMSYPT